MALVFRIGEGGISSFDQLPDCRNFPDMFPGGARAVDQLAPYCLGIALAVGCMKLYRSSSLRQDERVSLDPCGGWLLDIKDALDSMPPSYYGRAVGESCLMSLGVVFDMALNAPDRLGVLLQRIDALDNAALHRMTVAAVQGREVMPDLFEGLYE